MRKNWEINHWRAAACVIWCLPSQDLGTAHILEDYLPADCSQLPKSLSNCLLWNFQPGVDSLKHLSVAHSVPLQRNKMLLWCKAIWFLCFCQQGMSIAPGYRAQLRVFTSPEARWGESHTRCLSQTKYSWKTSARTDYICKHAAMGQGVVVAI